MSTDKEEPNEALGSRLSEITGTVGKSESRSKYSKAALLGGGIFAALVGVYVISTLDQPAPKEAVVPVAKSTEFPTDVAGFGEMAVPKITEAAPVNQEMAAAIEALKAQIAKIEAERTPTDQNADGFEQQQKVMAGKIADIQKQADDAAAAFQAQQETFQTQLDAKDETLRAERARFDVELQRASLSNIPDPLELERQQREQRQRDRLAALRAENDALQTARINSGLIAVGTGARSGGEEKEHRELNDNESFVKRALEVVPVSTALEVARPDITILQGTIIQASLETALDSTLPGVLRAVVSEDVHSLDGTNILIPRGSKLFGEYSSDIALAQNRILIAWTRILTPDNKSISITSYGTDGLGRSGTGGRVDSHFGQRFGSAALISLISAIPDIAASKSSSEIGSNTLQNVGDDLQEQTSSVIGEYLSIKPTIHVEQGAEIAVILDRDIEIP